MAKLVGVFAASHGPLMALEWEAVEPARREAAAGAFFEIGRRLTSSGADVLIMISPDHWVNFFIDNLPSVCIGLGEVHEGPPEPWLKDFPFQVLPGHPQLAHHIAAAALENDFEPSLSYHLKLDHGFAIPLWKIGVAPLPAIIPIIINDLEPPLPSVRRCLAWGDLIARAIESYPENLRVAIFATGGLSHSIGEPTMGRVDEAFDRECIAHFASGDPKALVEFLNARLPSAGNGGDEIRNWVMAHGAARARGFELIHYDPLTEWYIGGGWAAWNLQSA